MGFSNYVYVTDFNEKDYYTGDPVSENTIVNDNLYASVQYVPSRQLFFTFNGGISAYSNKTGDIHVTKVMPRLQGIINWVPTQKFALRASYLMQTGTPSLSQLMDYVQALWGNPPATGARIITSILCNPALFGEW